MEKKGKDTIENRRHASKKWRTKKKNRKKHEEYGDYFAFFQKKL